MGAKRRRGSHILSYTTRGTRRVTTMGGVHGQSSPQVREPRRVICGELQMLGTTRSCFSIPLARSGSDTTQGAALA